MKIFDANCLAGRWPFRKLYRGSFDSLENVHRENGIAGGCISSIDSIFYNDPFEGDEDLHSVITGTEYAHILTINPLLPGFADDIEKGVRLFDIKGVRIYPWYHGYDFSNAGFLQLCTVLERFGLPLSITVRMEDERLNYIVSPSIPKMDEIEGFIEKCRNIGMVLLNIRYGEILTARDVVNSRKNIYFDTSGLKDSLFVVENLVEIFGPEKILYGSLHPLYCLKSTLLLVQEAEIPDEQKGKILFSNFRQLYYGKV